MTTEPNLRLLSLGAGVQSTVLALMAADGTLPGLDGAIFADTGWEPRRVYEHLARLEKVLEAAGIPLYRVSNGNLRDDAVDPAHRYASLPLFILNHIRTEEPIKSSGVTCPDCQGTGWVGGGLRDGMSARDWNEAHPDDAEVEALEAAANERGCVGCDAGNGVPHTCYGACSTCQRPGGTPGVVYRDWYPVVKRQEGLGRRQCTSEYKLAPIRRKVRELLGAAAPDYRRVPEGQLAEQWIGFSTDEIGRVGNDTAEDDGTGKRRSVRYLRSRYPLLELGMSRADCEEWLKAAGWGSVAKSACIGCPFHGNWQWRQLRDTCTCEHHRDQHYDRFGNVGVAGGSHGRCSLCGCEEFAAPEWDDAVDFDAAIRKGGARGLPLNGTAYLHRSMRPLDEAPIDKLNRREWAGRALDIFDVLDQGDPDGCSPYGCRSGAAPLAEAEDGLLALSPDAAAS